MLVHSASGVKIKEFFNWSLLSTVIRFLFASESKSNWYWRGSVSAKMTESKLWLKITMRIILDQVYSHWNETEHLHWSFPFITLKHTPKCMLSLLDNSFIWWVRGITFFESVIAGLITTTGILLQNIFYKHETTSKEKLPLSWNRMYTEI